MNKRDLIEAIAASANLTKADAECALKGVLSAIESSLKEKESVALLGFGTFSVRHRPARNGRNPQTGKTLKIPAQDVPVFKPGTQLKAAVNGK